MVEINKLLAELVAQGVAVYLDNGKLKAKAQKGALTAEHKALISANKHDIIATLSQSAPIEQVERIQPVAEQEKQHSLSFAQQRLWFVNQLQGGGSEYNMPMAYSVYQPFDVSRATRALRTIIARHEILRTGYEASDEGPRRLVREQVSNEVQFTDLSALAEPVQRDEVKALALAHAGREFDLQHDALLDIHYVKLTDTPSGTQPHGILLFNMHHIASDAWSMDILKNEFMTLYSSEQGLPPLSVQYSDFAYWQQNWAKSQDYQDQLAYWRSHLTGLPELHSLTPDHPRPAKKKFSGKKCNQTLSAELTEKLVTIARHYQLSPFMCLHSALVLLLHTFTASRDIVVGTTVANRAQAEVAQLIGCFLNRLVLRVELKAQSLDSYLQHIRQVHLSAQANQDVPFEHLVEQLDVTRSNSYTPLFQIQLTCNDSGLADSPQAPKSTPFRPYVPEDMTMTIRGDIDIHAELGQEETVIGWSYDDALYSEQSITTMMAHLETILENYARCLDTEHGFTTSIDALTALSDTQFSQLQTQLPVTHSAYDARSLTERFEQQAVLTPDAIAVHSDTEQLSYAQLNAQAAKLADCLQEQGVEPGDLVGVCMPRSACLMVSLLGVLKAGAAYIPFEPSNTKARNQQIIADAALEWVIVSDALAARVPDAGVDLLLLEQDVTDANWLSGYDADFCAETVAHDSPAYVIYTSGSTGTPKGVEISHRALMDYLNFALKGYYADHLNGSLLVTSHGFDIGVPSLYLPLLSGGSVQLLDNQELLPVLSKALNKADEPRLVRMTPHHVEGVLALQEAPLAGVQHVFVIGGERFERDVALALQTQFPDSQVFNHYGPSEATVGCVMYDISANQADLPAELPIGRAMDNTYAYVLDAQLNALPQGARGELFVGGPCLATGYVNNPTLSAERFIENPFYDPSDATSPARLYRTGDQVRYQNSGELMFLGRIDEQVKIRGFRVELGDISSQLQQITGVESAEVLCKALATGPELVAYIKAENSAQLGALLSDCERLLGEQLPAYMVPAHFVGLQHWPLTANGKLDKKALPDPQEKAAAQHVAPRTATEQQLVELWSSLLKLTPDQISVDSSFFKLGGHSLLSVRLVAAIKQAFGVEFSISELFEHASIASQAQQVEHKQAQGGSTAQRIEVQARPQDGRMAASFAQQRLWFIDRLQGGSAQYNMPAAFEVSGELDLDAVEAALNTIVARHEVLRSVYRDGDSGTEQVIQTDVHFTLDYEDLRLLSPATQQQTIASLIPRLQSQPFDLSKDLMIRAAYIDTGADSEHASVLLFNIHHIASDGWSLQLLVKEFVQLYRAYTQNQDNPLTPLPIQYADYAHWQHSYLSGPVLERQLTYWSEQLSDLPPVHSLPLDHPRPQVKQHVGELVQGNLDSDVAAGLAELAQSQGLTSFMLLHSALSLLLSRHSNSKDVVIGTPVANRTQTELESLIGFFVNTLVLRVNTAQPDITRYLEHVKAVHLGAQSHQDVPFEQLVERLNVPRSTAHSPLFQIMLTTQTDYGLDEQATEQGELDLNGAALTMRGAAQTVAKFDIEVNISTSAQGVAINWVYDKALFTHAHISTLNRHLMQILTQLSQLQSTSVPLSSIALLSAQERTHLLETLNPAPVDYDTTLTMAQWIERQVAKTPTQTALCYEGQTLSYQSLNDKANQLARHLRAEHQVVPGTLVGVCMTRSLEMVIGILAILKAGGAYVPLDPTLPETRLDYMLAHAGITIILTQSDHQSKCQADSTLTLILMDGYAQDATRFEDYATQDLSPQETGLSAQDMAYMIYTSGSTGKPKGVLVSHQALVNRVDWMDKQYGCDHHDVILQKTPFGFDVSVWEFMWPLCRGAQMVLARPEGHKDPQYLCQLIRQSGVTKLHFVPSMLGIMLDYGALAQCTSIRQVFCSGEALQVKQVQGFRASLPDAQLHNLYGPTEAAIDVSYWDCSQPISTTVPIGKPIQNIQLLILDDDLQLVPFGSAGELFIGGDGLAWGYHNQPELTAERFITNPYQSEMGARASTRLYRTGDLVRYLDNGDIEYLGRSDDQIKINGLRIELGEIESALLAQPEVDSALVTTIELDQATQTLVAYFKSTLSATELDEAQLTEQLQARLSQSLPAYMVPTLLCHVSPWPVTANGKVDRRALPTPACKNVAAHAPQTDMEKQLATLWQQVLQCPRQTIYKESDFFALGGSSLKLITLAMLIEKSFACAVSLEQLFKTTQLAAQADLIAAGGTEQTTPQLKPLNNSTDAAFTVLCLPGAADLARSFMPLAQALEGEMTVYGYEHLPEHAAASSIQAYANEYCAHIRSHFMQPLKAGRLVLLGHSMGGLLAAEISKQLAPTPPALTILLDSYIACSDVSETNTEQALQALIKQLAIPAGFAEQFERLMLRHTSLAEGYQLTSEVAQRCFLIGARANPSWTEPYQIFLRDKLQLPHSSVAGDHYSILWQENIKELTAQIKQHIDQRIGKQQLQQERFEDDSVREV
ncbi:non-ribosomal peptide synthetase [Pseudoalteromonas rubra]|uniref:non-ribosomal peptide synthetase n=1 Tax=Pseudoalteromonas rubra TaxID=43658 RepID=UPI002DBE35AF|nr:non-ribosomal peptide synthetase [Pseudoalteromonas rubra]MEC4091091.1 amino acid adenylation domain-containing protein [Pseudoalteromonas rubra]